MSGTSVQSPQFCTGDPSETPVLPAGALRRAQQSANGISRPVCPDAKHTTGMAELPLMNNSAAVSRLTPLLKVETNYQA